MDRWYEIVWPTLVEDASAKRSNEKREQHELEAIEHATWNDEKPVLEEARRLADLEANRRKTAESKATIYLAALAAMLPLTGALVGASPEQFDASSQWQAATFVIMLCITAIYFVAAGVWSLRTIKTSVHHRLDVNDVLAAQKYSSAEAVLCKAILRSVVNNRSGTNRKVDCMSMAHAFFVNLFVLYVVLLVFVGWVALWPSAQAGASLATEDVSQEMVTSEASKYPLPEAVQAHETPLSEPNSVSELGGLDHSANEKKNSDAQQGPVTHR